MEKSEMEKNLTAGLLSSASYIRDLLEILYRSVGGAESSHQY